MFRDDQMKKGIVLSFILFLTLFSTVIVVAQENIANTPTEIFREVMTERNQVVVDGIPREYMFYFGGREDNPDYIPQGADAEVDETFTGYVATIENLAGEGEPAVNVVRNLTYYEDGTLTEFESNIPFLKDYEGDNGVELDQEYTDYWVAPAHIIFYEYQQIIDEDGNQTTRLIKKSLATEQGIINHQYTFEYNKATGNLETVQRWGKSNFLDRLEVKEYTEFHYEEGNPDVIGYTLYDSNDNPTYSFYFPEALEGEERALFVQYLPSGELSFYTFVDIGAGEAGADDLDVFNRYYTMQRQGLLEQ